MECGESVVCVMYVCVVREWSVWYVVECGVWSVVCAV